MLVQMMKRKSVVDILAIVPQLRLRFKSVFDA